MTWLSWVLIALGSLILIGVAGYFLISKYSKYKLLYKTVLQDMAIKQQADREQDEYLENVEKKLEIRDRLLEKIGKGELTNDELNRLRSGLQSIESTDIGDKVQETKDA